MPTPQTVDFLTYFRGAALNPNSDIDSFKPLAEYTKAAFNTEDEAYVEMLKFLDLIETMEPLLRFDVKHHFFAYNLEYFFMRECPSYQPFWTTARSKYYEEVAFAFDDAFVSIDWDEYITSQKAA